MKSARPAGLRTAVWVALAGAGLIVAACYPTPRQRYQRRLVDTGDPALHAVHSDRLREIMVELNDLAFDRLPQEMDPTAARDRRIREVSALAATLADDAGLLEGMLDADSHPEKDRRVFDSFAQKLGSQAKALMVAAEANDLGAMDDNLGELVATCNACHSTFRQLPQLP